jgi:hypothetical protein
MVLALLMAACLILSGCGKKTENQPAETSAPQQPITITPPSPAIPGAPGEPSAMQQPAAAASFVPKYAMSAGRKDPFAPVVWEKPAPPPDITSLVKSGPGGSLPPLPGAESVNIPLMPMPTPIPVTVQVTGIMRAGGKVMAILQDGAKSDVVGPGDRFGAYRVKSIKKKTVVLDDGERVIKLGIPEQ